MFDPSICGGKPPIYGFYIGNLGKIENGIVAVTSYGVLKGMTFPLIAEVYKPRERLKKGDQDKTKP